MLTSEEVYAIMKEDILELQRKRIKELEEALLLSTELINKHIYGAGEIVFENKKLLEKGISL